MDQAAADALCQALIDEWAGEDYYHQMVTAFGTSRRLDNLIGAEQRHAGSLLALCERYNVEPPKRPDNPTTVVPATYRAAVEQAIEFEKANAALYDALLQNVKNEDIRDVFAHLRDASRYRHLPAWQRAL